VEAHLAIPAKEVHSVFVVALVGGVGICFSVSLSHIAELVVRQHMVLASETYTKKGAVNSLVINSRDGFHGYPAFRL
jgi:hypothetical protein